MLRFIGHEDPACGIHVYWILHLKSRCEIIARPGGEGGLRPRGFPFHFSSLHPGGSVLVDPKDPDSVELGQFGDQDAHQGDGVDYEVYPVIFRVETGEEIQHDGRDGQELARCRELHPIVHLLPVREQPGFPLVRRLKGRSFHRVQEDVHTHVVDDVGESPNHGDTEEGDAEEDHMQQANPQHVGEPDAPAVHDAGVGVHLTVRRPHVHAGSRVG